MNEYLINSEGTVTRNGKTTYSVTLNSTAQADDGMRLSRNPYWMVAKAEELPTREKLVGESKKMLDTLVALRKAPIVEEEYRGPVLFAPDAANDAISGAGNRVDSPLRSVKMFTFTHRNPEMQLDKQHTALVLADIQNEFLQPGSEPRYHALIEDALKGFASAPMAYATRVALNSGANGIRLA